jgi:hypothetical protein
LQQVAVDAPPPGSDVTLDVYTHPVGEGDKAGQVGTRERRKRRRGASGGWLRGVDLNHRPLGYEPNELPDCSTPHFDHNQWHRHRQTAGRLKRHTLAPTSSSSSPTTRPDTSQTSLPSCFHPDRTTNSCVARTPSLLPSLHEDVGFEP